MNEELTFLEVIEFFRNHFFKLVGGALLGGVLGLAIALMIPMQWEASALVRVGQLGSAEITANIGSPIEPSLQTVDRMKNKSFQNDVLKSLNLSISDNGDVVNDFRDTLKVKLEKSDLINLSIRATSSDEAKRYMMAIISEIKSIHTKMSLPSLNRWRQELASVELELKQTNTELDRLTQSLNSTSGTLNEKHFSQSALLSNILLARETELKILHERKRDIEAQLSPERSFATKELGRIEMSEEPVFPKKPLFSLVGLFLGLILAVFWSMLKSAIGRVKVA